MRIWKFIKLFHLIYGKNPTPDLSQFQELGLLAVKIGQMYALRSDFLSTEKCDHLRQLYRLNTPILTANLKQRFEANAEKKLLAELSSFTDKPLATASVGQVHIARLKSEKEVVIKITKDDFKNDFEQDVKALMFVFNLAIFFYPKLAKVADPIGTLKTVSRTTLAELDLMKEKSGQDRLAEIKNKYLGQFDFDSLKFPQIYTELSNKNVLVMERLKYPTFDELIQNKQLTYTEVLKLFKIHGAMMFIAGEFHGDLHPGNIFFNNGDIYFIDISTIETVHKEISKGLLNFFLALAKNDYDSCSKAIHSMSLVKLDKIAYEKFRGQMLELYANFAGKTVSETSLTTQMMRTVKVAVKSGMQFPSGIFAIIKSLMYLDGMVIKTAPNTVLAEMLADLGIYTEEILEKAK